MPMLPQSVLDALDVDGNRQFLQKLEAELARFVENPPSTEHHIPSRQLPNSYFRLLTHLFCQYYRLRTWTNQAGGISLAVSNDVDYETLLEVVETLVDVLAKLDVPNAGQVEAGPPLIVAAPEYFSPRTVQNYRNNGDESEMDIFGMRNSRPFNRFHPGRIGYSKHRKDSGNGVSALGSTNTDFKLHSINNKNAIMIIKSKSFEGKNGNFDLVQEQIRSDIRKVEDSAKSPSSNDGNSVAGELPSAYRHVQFSPDAAPFYPSYPAYFYVGNPGSYPSLYDEQTERQILNNPYIILPGDKKNRRKSSKTEN